MRFIKLTLTAASLALVATGCADLEVTNLNDPDRARAITSPGDVEALISGSYQSFWDATQGVYPAAAFLAAADYTSVAWGNFGFRDAGEMPRKAYNNDPSYAYNNVTETPWTDLYAALAAARDGLLAIEGGIDIGANGADTPRAIAFGKMVQGLAHGYLALTFDKAFVLVEETDVAALEFSSYDEVLATALSLLDEAEQMALSGSFVIPADWVGFQSEMNGARMARFIRSYRARLMSQVGRTPAEREASNWNRILQDAQSGIGSVDPSETYGALDPGSATWAWSSKRFYGATLATWTRADLHWLGQADMSGKYAAWLATPAGDRSEFGIVTTDRRVTKSAATPFEAGSKFLIQSPGPWPAVRGTYHRSNYMSNEYLDELIALGGDVFYLDLAKDEMDLMAAEAMYRTGNYAGAIAIVNASRAKGNLPPLEGTGQNAVAPGGPGSCVPMPDGVTCARLLEALQYEKQMEIVVRGLGTEFFDDRGWGNLAPDTYRQLPVPGSELLLLLEDIYTFGGSASAPSSGAQLVDDTSVEALSFKRQAFDRYRALSRENGDRSFGIAH